MTTEVIELPEPAIAEKSELPAVKKRIWQWVIVGLSVLLGVILISLTVAYVKVSLYFEGHFFPNTIINGIDCSHKTAAEAAGLIFEQSLVYQLEVLDQDGQAAGIIKAAEIGFFIDIDMDVEAVLRNQENQRWIFEYTNPSSHVITYDISFDYQLLSGLIRQWDIFNLSEMSRPENAFLSEYNEEIKGYEIIAETRGNMIDFRKANDLIVNAVYNRKSRINLETEGCYIRAAITVDDRELNQRAAILNRLVGTKIIYDWNSSEIILDGDLIHQWVSEENGVFTVCEEQVREFVITHARENDTYGRRRTFVTTAGVERSLPGGGFGWRTNRTAEIEELLELIQYGVVMEREPNYLLRGWHKGQNDIGPSYVEIDLTNQHLYLYIEGERILDSELVSGNMSQGMATPAGVFGITYRERNAVLRGATYTTPVSYWMPFNGNIGMHDATWRRSFGGDIYINDGSHGCINLPYSVAKEIFSYISAGFPVVCYY
ncbi:MAG: L,D-transpeptidase [Lachnospiraceae bacterium]|nr:L,D-transpeptidase [Lachnospiraceae bacterium]